MFLKLIMFCKYIEINENLIFFNAIIMRMKLKLERL